MSTTIDRAPELVRQAGQPMIGSRAPRVKRLLACGAIYGVAYVVANDLIAATFYDGYSRMTQAISELSATGAPTKTFLSVTAPIFSGLMLAFGVGVWKAARGRRSLRVAGGLLALHGAWMPLWLLAPMSQREAIAAGAGTSSDTMHIVLSGLTGVFVLSEILFGAAAFEKRFRLYSVLTAASVVVFAAVLTSVASADLGSGNPTPWLGLVERIGVYSWMLWMAVLAVALYRRQDWFNIQRPSRLTRAESSR